MKAHDIKTARKAAKRAATKMEQLVRRLSDGPQVDMASAIEEAEEMLPEVDLEESLLAQRKFDLAVSLAERYRGLISHWQWRESIVSRLARRYA